MAKIIDINGEQVVIANDSGKIVRVPIAMVKYSAPKINDRVQVFQDGKDYVVTRNDGTDEATKSVNKNIFVWVGCFLFGWTGADRHMRGQHGLGVLKLCVTTIMPIVFTIIFIMALVAAIPFDQIECYDDVTDYPTHGTTYYAGENSYAYHYYHDYDYDDYYEDEYYCEVNGEDIDEYMERFFEDDLFIIICGFVVLLLVTSVAGGIWCLVDWIISLTKAYGSNHSDKLCFDEHGHYLN